MPVCVCVRYSARSITADAEFAIIHSNVVYGLYAGVINDGLVNGVGVLLGKLYSVATTRAASSVNRDNPIAYFAARDRR